MFLHALTFLMRSLEYVSSLLDALPSRKKKSFNLKSLRRHDNFYWVPKVNWHAE